MPEDGLQPPGPKQPAFVLMRVSFLRHLVRKQTHRIFMRAKTTKWKSQSYFSMTTRTTSPCVHAPTCPLSQPHHSMPMHSNPRTTMMEVASQPSDECLLVSLSFTDILGLLGAESRSPIIIRDEKRREAREEVLVEEEEMHRNGSRKYEWLIPQWCTMHLWQVFMHF
ncbi:hypothetical protein CFC21_029111 [Triticum aestivum]|uniref:Uncharacterized protein n=2 Tax=Triticum aestivum TaxID=4565 RepID=A0A9R1ERX9_WHEAT|nr:hypothetical protein CFC21_029111 [Triticum aestivum]